MGLGIGDYEGLIDPRLLEEVGDLNTPNYCSTFGE